MLWNRGPISLLPVSWELFVLSFFGLCPTSSIFKASYSLMKLSDSLVVKKGWGNAGSSDLCHQNSAWSRDLFYASGTRLGETEAHFKNWSAMKYDMSLEGGVSTWAKPISSKGSKESPPNITSGNSISAWCCKDGYPNFKCTSMNISKLKILTTTGFWRWPNFKGRLIPK